MRMSAIDWTGRNVELTPSVPPSFTPGNDEPGCLVILTGDATAASMCACPECAAPTSHHTREFTPCQ